LFLELKALKITKKSGYKKAVQYQKNTAQLWVGYSAAMSALLHCNAHKVAEQMSQKQYCKFTKKQGT
jgi:hypothetical protein